MRDTELEQCFPKLQNSNYKITSPEDPRYNCVAFSVGCTTLFFQLLERPSKTYYWPPGIPRDDTLECWIQLYTIHGYKPCEIGDLEPNVEKIAIYVGATGEPLHVARQLVSGWWQSKLGQGQDLEHETLESLEGYDMDEYGKVACFLSRPLRSPETGT
jgi:hypothetical protein